MENLQPPALLSIIRELPMPCHVDLGGRGVVVFWDVDASSSPICGHNRDGRADADGWTGTAGVDILLKSS